jgi:hypothetical protein
LYHFYLYMYVYLTSPEMDPPQHRVRRSVLIVGVQIEDYFPSILKMFYFVSLFSFRFPPTGTPFHHSRSPLYFTTPLRFPPLPRNVFDVPLHVLLLTRERSYPSHSFKISWCVAVQCTSERQHPKDCGKSTHCAGTNLVFSSQQ